MLRRLQAGQSARQLLRDGVVDRKTAARYFEAAMACAIGPETELSDALVAEVAQRLQARPTLSPSGAWTLLKANRHRIEAWLSALSLQLSARQQDHRATMGGAMVEGGVPYPPG